MKKSMMAFGVAVAVCMGAGALAAAEKPALPDATGEAVVKYMKAANFQQWALMPGTIPMREGKQPHGARQNVYINDVARQGMATKSSPMPEGSMIVKENFTADSVLQGFTIMYKKKGFNPDAGDYFWLNLGPDMKVKSEGKLAGCIGCHSPAAGPKDYIILNNPVK